MLAQHAVAEGVKRRDETLGVTVRDELVDALGHLAGCLFRERERENLFGAGFFGGDEMGDSARENRGFSRPGARHDQERAGAVQNRAALGLVEAVENDLLAGLGGGRFGLRHAQG